MSDHRTASVPKTVGFETLAEPPRRSFFYHFVTAVIGGVVGLVPLAAGLATYFDPLRRKRAGADYLPVAALDAIPDASQGDVLIGRFPVVATRTDAWSTYPNEPIGSVYLIVPKGTKEVKALQMTCPHLGCAVDVQTAGDVTIFKCPCHTSAFELTGKRIMPCVSARDMDELKCEVHDVRGKREVYVQFQNFQPGLEEKKVKG